MGGGRGCGHTGTDSSQDDIWHDWEYIRKLLETTKTLNSLERVQ